MQLTPRMELSVELITAALTAPRPGGDEVSTLGGGGRCVNSGGGGGRLSTLGGGGGGGGNDVSTHSETLL